MTTTTKAKTITDNGIRLEQFKTFEGLKRLFIDLSSFHHEATTTCYIEVACPGRKSLHVQITEHEAGALLGELIDACLYSDGALKQRDALAKELAKWPSFSLMHKTHDNDPKYVKPTLWIDKKPVRK